MEEKVSDFELGVWYTVLFFVWSFIAFACGYGCRGAG